LQRAGFIVDRIAGSHYIMAHSRCGDLKPGTLCSIIRQAGLTVEELRNLL